MKIRMEIKKKKIKKNVYTFIYIFIYVFETINNRIFYDLLKEIILKKNYIYIFIKKN